MSKIYLGLINTADRFVPNGLRPLWNHAAGKLTASQGQSNAIANNMVRLMEKKIMLCNNASNKKLSSILIVLNIMLVDN